MNRISKRFMLRHDPPRTGTASSTRQLTVEVPVCAAFVYHGHLSVLAISTQFPAIVGGSIPFRAILWCGTHGLLELRGCCHDRPG